MLRVTLFALGAITAWMAIPETARADVPKPVALRFEHYVKAGVRREALAAAFKAYSRRKDKVKRTRFLTLIDYALHSSRPRMYVFDTVNGSMKALHVAHGKGSDPDHDGYADRFSNIPESKMSSLGAFVTANTYYGKHGLSMRLIGLDKTNNKALQRAIVMHGASYVNARRGVGRSWGCPSIENRYVKEWIPKLAGGNFLYITR